MKLRRQPQVVGGRRFESLNALRNEIDACINAGSIEQGFAFALLKRHPYFAQLVTPGLDRVDIGTNSRGHRGLRVVRVDGTSCIVKKRRLVDEGSAERVAFAARQAVFDDIAAFKSALFAAGPVVCAVSGQPLTFERCDLDHQQPWSFAEILRHWLAKLDFEPETMAKSRDYDVPAFACEAHAECFRSFHAQRMHLRPLAPIENRGNFGSGLAADQGGAA